ncbi:MAG TPA: hypothetical protein VH063_17110 [Gaiellaceae bacterium]|jgi:hypothetical protein|nr:hypothetical protein [Gaiellaceae bacterium]
MRRARPREPNAEIESRAAPVDSSAGSFAEGVMELQRSAGNQAVGALLSRDADRAPEGERSTSTTLVMPDPLGVLPVEAFTMPRGERDTTITITIPAAAVTPALMNASANGTVFPTATLSTGYMSYQLLSVIVASVQLGSGGGATITLNAAGLETVSPKDKAQGKVD